MMKTLKVSHILASIINIVLVASLSTSAIAREAVNGAKSASASKSTTEMTEEERKMGGTTSPYPSCSGMLMVEAGVYNKNKAYWEKRKTSCDSKVANCTLNVQMIPDSGVFASRSVMPGVNVSSAVTVGEFLETVRLRASSELANAITAQEKKNTECFNSSGAAPAWCKGAVADIKSRVAKELPAFRKAVALMAVADERELQKAIVTNDVSGLIDSDLTSSKSFALVPKMDKLNSAEMADAKKHYETLLAQARKEFDAEVETLLAPLKVKGRETDLAAERKRLTRAENFTIKVKEVFRRSSGEYAAQYTAAISRVPEVAYVGSAAAADSIVAAGLASMIKDSKASLARIKKSPPNAKELAAAKVDSSLLQYAAYSRLIDKMLVEEQTKGTGASSCAVATAAFNQLKTVEGRNAGYATVAMVGGTVALAVAPWAASAMGVGMSAGAAALSANLAVATGLIGGFAMTGYDAYHASNIVQDGRSGLVSAKDVEEAKTAAGIGLIASPLNFLGAGALVGGGISAAALASKSMLKSFGANAVAKGAVQAAGTSADDVAKLAVTAAAVQAGDAAAKSAATIAAKEAAAKIEKVGEKGANEILKRPATATDEGAFRSMAGAGWLGNEKAPNFKVASAYASVTQDMSAAARTKFAEDLATVTKVVADSRAAAVKAGKPVDPVRDEAVAMAGLQIAKGAPDAKAAATVLENTSGYDAAAVSGVGEAWRRTNELVGATKALAKGVSEAVSAKVARTAKSAKTALAKLTGKNADSPEVNQLCVCMAACPAKIAEANPLEMLAPPKFVACVH